MASALRERIVAGLHIGRFRGGERLPSARTLAREFGVNERVALAALRTLADEGLLDVRRRAGAYAVPPHAGRDGTLPVLGRWIVERLVQARTRGLAPREVEYVRRSFHTVRLRAACIECNGDELHALCSELADDHGVLTEPVDVEALHGAHVSPGLGRADLLVTTAFHILDVQPVAERLGKPWIAVALHPDTPDGVVRALQEGVVYFVAADARFEGKLHRILGPLGNLANLRVLLLDRDDLGTIPRDAPTFVMPGVRARVAPRYGARGIGRPIHPRRFLSDEATGELLTHVVRVDMAARG